MLIGARRVRPVLATGTSHYVLRFGVGISQLPVDPVTARADYKLIWVFSQTFFGRDDDLCRRKTAAAAAGAVKAPFGVDALGCSARVTDRALVDVAAVPGELPPTVQLGLFIIYAVSSLHVRGRGRESPPNGETSIIYRKESIRPRRSEGWPRG